MGPSELMEEVVVYRCINPFCGVVAYKAIIIAPFCHCPACNQLGRVGEDVFQKEVVNAGGMGES